MGGPRRQTSKCRQNQQLQRRRARQHGWPLPTTGQRPGCIVHFGSQGITPRSSQRLPVSPGSPIHSQSTQACDFLPSLGPSWSVRNSRLQLHTSNHATPCSHLPGPPEAHPWRYPGCAAGRRGESDAMSLRLGERCPSRQEPRPGSGSYPPACQGSGGADGDKRL